MFYNILAVFMLAGAVAVASKPFSDVDINSLTCDPRGTTFALLPHFSDCSKYYTCDNGREVEMNCAPGTIFDFELQTCNWPFATECVLRSEENPEDEIEGSGSGDGEYQWSEAENEAILEPLGLLGELSAPVESNHFATVLDCTRADSASHQLVHKGDCQRYWRCVAGTLQSFYCSDGLFFNEQTQQCDFEANVKCLVEQEDELQGEFMIHK